MEEEESCLNHFLFEYNAKNLVKEMTCFNSIDNPSCIDIFLTNSYQTFQNTTTIATGLSDVQNTTTIATGLSDVQNTTTIATGLSDVQNTTTIATGLSDVQNTTTIATGLSDVQNTTTIATGLSDVQNTTTVATGLSDVQNTTTIATGLSDVQNTTTIATGLSDVQNTTTIATGLSDVHKMAVTVMKPTFPKAKPKVIQYRDYKHFVLENFHIELTISLQNEIVENYAKFEKIFLESLDKHAPLKKKILRANNKPYMSKTLRKAITRSALKNRYYRDRLPESEKAFKKQRNFTAKLLKKEKKKYFSSINMNNYTDEEVAKTCKSFFYEFCKVT